MIGVEVYESPHFTHFGEVDPPATDWRFRVRAVNGEIVAQSEAYTTKAAAEKGIRALRRALLPGTRDAEAMAKAWDDGYHEGFHAAGGISDATCVDRDMTGEPNPYRKEVPGNG